MLLRKAARRKTALWGFLLGFLSVWGPLALFLSISASAGNVLVWLGTAATAAVGGGATAGMSRRRSPQGARRGLMLAAVAWFVVLAALTAISGGYFLYILLFFVLYLVPIGCVIGLVLGLLLGPARPHPDKETVRRFEAVQTERARRRLTSSRSASRI